MKKKIIGAVVAAFCFLNGATAGALDNGEYRSPYAIEYNVPTEDLAAPDFVAPRNDPHLESKVPFDQWYSSRVRKDSGAWGPGARQYPPIAGAASAAVTWKRQRVLMVAQKHIGLPYQHHHVPAWDPPSSWPWKKVAYGHNSPGLDCSNFTSWVYNYGLGIKLNSDIDKQASMEDVEGPSENSQIHARTILNENGYEDLIRKLKTGDLLYIKNQQGSKVSHVIMWVGVHGKSPDGTPLVIDCTGPDHKDCNDTAIPIGVQLRPFSADSWYFKSFSHAHRILHEGEG